MDLPANLPTVVGIFLNCSVAYDASANMFVIAVPAGKTNFSLPEPVILTCLPLPSASLITVENCQSFHAVGTENLNNVGRMEDGSRSALTFAALLISVCSFVAKSPRLLASTDVSTGKLKSTRSYTPSFVSIMVMVY